MAFYFKLGLGREGRGFESISWVFFFFFLGGGGGVCFLNWSFVGRWGWFYFNVLGGLFFIKGTFCLLTFFSVLWWNFINICLTFTHSFTQFFHVLWGGVNVGRCAFYVLGQTCSLRIVFGRLGWSLKGPGWCDLCRLIR